MHQQRLPIRSIRSSAPRMLAIVTPLALLVAPDGSAWLRSTPLAMAAGKLAGRSYR